jgi:hypothetical protein
MSENEAPVWMMSAVKRLAMLERAIYRHRELTLQGELSRDAIDNALWAIYEFPTGCTGDCCG